MHFQKELKAILFSLISPNQTAHLENRFISEGDRLAFDTLEIRSNKYRKY